MVWAWVGAVVAGLLAYLLDRRRRRFADLPNTPAAAVFAGRNEVVGRAWAARPLVSHLTKAPSVWWEYTLEEERRHTRTVTSTDSDGNTTTRTEQYTEWHEVDRQQQNLPEVEVVDETGSVLVRLAAARVVARQYHREVVRRDRDGGFFAKMFDSATGRYRETENGVAIGDQLFVVGEAVLDEERLVPILSERVMVSTRTEGSHRSWLGAGAIVALLATVVLVTVAIALAIAPDDPSRPRAWLPGIAVVVVALLVAWATTSYNRLRLVAQGTDRAWSLIDVQLRRRHDLIPALADVVRAHSTYESDALVAATSQRGSAMAATTTAGAVEAEAVRQSEVLRSVIAVAEATPELTADEAYRSLQRQLADTEDRIAASRTFYNSSLTLLQDRRQTFPSSLIASRVLLGHRELLAAERFERTVPVVRREFEIHGGAQQ